MPEWGYGSPSCVSPASTEQTTYDWGYGSPTPATIVSSRIDTGFGSPTEPTQFTGAIIIPADGILPDEGGWICEVVSVLGFPDSIFRARFEDNDSGDLFPVTDFVYSAEVGNKTSLIPFGPTDAKDTIKFSSPSCPPAVYNLILQYGPGFAQEINVKDAYTVVNRNRCRPALRSRLRLSPYYKTGPVLLSLLEQPDAPDVLDPLECITLAIGQSMQKLIGVPVTRLTADVTAGSTTMTVETTLGFPPDSGSFFIRNLRFDYSGTTSTSFTGLTLNPSDQVWQITIGDPEEVVFDAASYQPID